MGGSTAQAFWAPPSYAEPPQAVATAYVPAGEPWTIPDRIAEDPSLLIGQTAARYGARDEGADAARDAGPVSALISGLRSGVSAGFYDEAQGLARASGLSSWVPENVSVPVGLARLGLDWLGATDTGAADRYAEGRDFTRGYAETQAATSPLASLAGEIAGGAAIPLGMASRGINAVQQVGRGMTAGALYGATSGAGGGEGYAERAERAGIGGTLGGTLGGLVALAPLARATPALAPARPAGNPGDEAIEAIRAGLARSLPQSPYLAPRTGTQEVADAALTALETGLRRSQPAQFAASRGAMSPDQAIEALHLGLRRTLPNSPYFADPSLPLPFLGH